MQNADLKSLVTHMYDNLLDLIDQQDNATTEQVVNYLQDAINTVESIDSDNLNSVGRAKEAFTNAYKEIAVSSLISYKSTSGRFEELTQMNEDTLHECEKSISDSLTPGKFAEINTDMNEEVLKANAIIFQLLEQVKTLEKTSNMDALTKVLNRRALTTHLNKICTGEGIPYELHLLVLDIDNFKLVNDKYGHVAGDKILIYIANILKKTLRDGDKIFRYGGEEFVIILNRTDYKNCVLITERLLELIRSNTLIYMGENIQVTASIGTTQYRQTDKPDTIIARADKALYHAKSTGKNKMHSEV